MGGKNQKQVVGKEYRSTFVVKLGHAIDGIIAIRAENKSWIYFDEKNKKAVPAGEYTFSKNSYFGKDGGKFGGKIAIYTGQAEQEPHAVYATKYSLASGYPYESYCVFYGNSVENKEIAIPNPAPGFPHFQKLLFKTQIKTSGFSIGRSGSQPELQYRVKRIHVHNDHAVQWYDEKAEVPFFLELDSVPADQFFYEVEIKSPAGVFTSTGQGYETLYPPNQDVGYIGGINRGRVDGLPDETMRARMLIPSLMFAYEVDVRLSADNVLDWAIESGEVIVLEKTEASGSQETCYLHLLILPNGDPFILSAIATNAWHSGNPNGSSPMHVSISAYFLRAFTVAGGSDADKNGDMNPAHIIRELLTEDINLNHSVDLIDDANFKRAADRLYVETLGLSKRVENEKCSDLIEQVCTHMHGGVRQNIQTGLFEIVLFRDDWFEENEIHAIDKKYVSKLKTQTINGSKCVNKINVTWRDREQSKDASFSVLNDASIAAIGKEVAQDVDLTWFSVFKNANIVSNWVLKQQGTPHYKGSFSTGWEGARKWNKYDLLWLQIDDELVLVRIMKISLGDGLFSNKTKIEFEEYVPTGDLKTTVELTPIERPDQSVKPCDYQVFEVPFYNLVMMSTQRQVEDELAYNSDYGLLGVITEQPQINSSSALLQVLKSSEWQDAANVAYCPTAKLDQALDRITSSFVIYDANDTILDVKSGSLIKCNEEWMSFVSFDIDTAILTVKRGVHCIPQLHTADAKLWFCGNSITIDQSEYVADQEIDAACLTVTANAVQERTSHKTVTFNSVAYRPYPPANVKMNDLYWPDLIEDHLTLTWSHRNRLQQTSTTEMIGYFEPSLTVESGVTYTVEVYDDETNLLKHRVSEITANTVVIDAVHYAPRTKIRLFAVRDSYESQAFEHVFSSAALEAPYNTKLRYIADLQPPYNIKLEYL